MGVRALAVDAEAIEGCGVRRGEIAVGAAAGRSIQQIETDFGGRTGSDEKGYITGCPELIVEIASSTTHPRGTVTICPWDAFTPCGTPERRSSRLSSGPESRQR